MNMNDAIFSPASVLSEQIARQMFESLPENGPVMVIFDREGNCWPSNTEEFSRLHLNESFLREVCSKVDDGEEPVVTQLEEYCIVSSQLATKQTNCGYVVIVLPQYSPESALANINLIEILLGQVNLIARLMEKNNMLYEMQMRHHSSSSFNS